MIFIQCSVEKLLQNIYKRGREYEMEISADYLEELNEAYNHFFYHYDRSPLLIINANEIDFVNNEDHLEYIENQIFKEPLKSLRTHIHPR